MRARTELPRLVRFKWVILAYSIRSVFSLALAACLAPRLAPVNVMALPRMDRELFAPGGRVLVQVLVEQSIRLLPWLRFGWTVGLIAVAVGALASAGIITALALPPSTSRSVWLRRAAQGLPTQLGIVLTGWIGFLAILSLSQWAYGIIPALVYRLLGEKGADIAIVIGVLVLAFSGVLGFALADLARAHNAQLQTGVRDSFAAAMSCLALRFRACMAGAFGYALLALFLPVLVERGLPQVSTLSPGKLVLTVFVHQGAVLGLCALHLGWWAMAIKLVQVPQKT